MTTSPESTGLTNGLDPQPAEGSEPAAPQSAEEVEAIWRNRFSQRDKAHNAELQSLREQLNALQQSASAQPPADGSNPDAGYKSRYEQTLKELEQERQQRVITERRMKFPALASEVPADDPSWTVARDETLARLNANLAAISSPPAPTGPIDRNNPRRDAPGSGTKDLTQMSKDELLRELERLSPAEAARMSDLF